MGIFKKAEKPETEEPPATEPPKPKYVWSNRPSVIHSCRVIMDEHGLKWQDKATLCAVIKAESNFNTQAVNNNFVNGKIASSDWGICQINDFWWIGDSKYFKSVEEVLNYPEKSVDFMCKMYTAGKLGLWCAHKNGSYKKYVQEFLNYTPLV